MQQGQAPAPSFREATRQQIVNIPSQIMDSFGKVLLFQLPQTGYLARIWLYFTGTLTTPAGGQNAWATYPALPYALIRRLRVYTSENVELVNCSGISLAIHALMWKRVQTLKDAPSSWLNTNNKAANYATQTGTPSASTGYTFSGELPIPIATDDVMMLGLILTQTQDVRVYLEITTANAADVSATTGIIPAINFYPSVEYFSVPPDSRSQPNLQYTQTLLEEPFPISTNGDVIYRPQIGNVYLELLGIVENNGAQVAPSAITAVSLKYAQTISPLYETYAQHVARMKFMYGVDIPDGMFAFMFDNGAGMPGLLEPRDWLNTSEQTDLQVIVNLTGLTFTAAQFRILKKQLSRIG